MCEWPAPRKASSARADTPVSALRPAPPRSCPSTICSWPAPNWLALQRPSRDWAATSQLSAATTAASVLALPPCPSIRLSRSDALRSEYVSVGVDDVAGGGADAGAGLAGVGSDDVAAADGGAGGG